MKITSMKSIRIGAGLGFYGDNWEPVAASIERGDVQFIASDHLAELTLAILQKDRQRDPALGYARDVVPMLMKLWPLMRERGVRLVCNAGGLNPRGAAQAVLAAFKAKGWRARVAVVTGDDVLPRLLDADAPVDGFAHLFTGASVADVRERLVFGNAYLGARPIVQALDAGADIVITGRVADAALFLGPLVHSLGWTLDGAAGNTIVAATATAAVRMRVRRKRGRMMRGCSFPSEEGAPQQDGGRRGAWQPRRSSTVGGSFAVRSRAGGSRPRRGGEADRRGPDRRDRPPPA
jgi:hypothetical protein